MILHGIENVSSIEQRETSRSLSSSQNLPSFPRRRAVYRDEKDKVVTPLG